MKGAFCGFTGLPGQRGVFLLHCFLLHENRGWDQAPVRRPPRGCIFVGGYAVQAGNSCYYGDRACTGSRADQYWSWGRFSFIQCRSAMESSLWPGRTMWRMMTFCMRTGLIHHTGAPVWRVSSEGWPGGPFKVITGAGISEGQTVIIIFEIRKPDIHITFQGLDGFNGHSRRCCRQWEWQAQGGQGPGPPWYGAGTGSVSPDWCYGRPLGLQIQEDAGQLSGGQLFPKVLAAQLPVLAETAAQGTAWEEHGPLPPGPFFRSADARLLQWWRAARAAFSSWVQPQKPAALVSSAMVGSALVSSGHGMAGPGTVDAHALGQRLQDVYSCQRK